MQNTSPKKYIQTRARNLPVYKCVVNRDWQAGGIANVIVMRRHVNGNITAGVYLVDLFCLGIKDSFFFFNEDAQKMEERFPPDMFMEIDYATAHNIVFAGHDFALDFDIHPSKDFAVTRFILEEDSDAIPLIEIPTGDENGRPHLLVHTPGQHSEALAKLRKNAGEGNYTYTITEGLDSNDDEPEDDNGGIA